MTRAFWFYRVWLAHMRRAHRGDHIMTGAGFHTSLGLAQYAGDQMTGCVKAQGHARPWWGIEITSDYWHA